MSTQYIATVTVATKTADVDTVMEQLADYHVSLGENARGYANPTIAVTAETLAQATRTALAVVVDALDAPAIALDITTAEEFDAREGWEHVPDLVTVAQAAATLGVTKQAVQKRIDAGSLPATRVGNLQVLPASAISATRGAAADQRDSAAAAGADDPDSSLWEARRRSHGQVKMLHRVEDFGPDADRVADQVWRIAKVSKSDPRPPFQQVAAGLTTQIRCGAWAAGDKLPSTAQLANTYGVSPMTITKAVKVLADEGLVEGHQGKGVYVLKAAAGT